MEYVIIISIIWISLIGLAQFKKLDGGTKGLRKKPYITKSGEKHTADKYREEHIL